MTGVPFRCRWLGHDWQPAGLEFRRVGEDQTCRNCGAVAKATRRGWMIYRDGELVKTMPETAVRESR